MWSRLDGETDEELIYRICSLKGSEGLENWQSIANVLNEITGQEYTESKYRKQYQAFQKMLNGNQRLFVNDDSQFAELEVQKRELAKERQKLSDARVDYNRIIREEARKAAEALKSVRDEMIKAGLPEELVDELLLRSINTNE